MNWRWIPVVLVSLLVLCIMAFIAVILIDVKDRGISSVVSGPGGPLSGMTAAVQPRSYAKGTNPIRIMVLDPPADGDTTDVLEIVEAMNDENAPPLPTSFASRNSQVVAAPSPTAHPSGGYVIQFASQSPVGTPAVHAGVVVVDGGFTSHVGYAFEAPTGAPLWGVSMDDGGPSAADVDDDLTVFNTESCSIFALDTNTGQMRWAYYLADPQISRPELAGDVVISSYPAFGGLHMNYSFDVTADDRHIVATHAVIAMDRQDGSLRWQKWIDGDIMTQPVADMNAGVLHFATFSGTVYQMDLATGEFLAAHATRATSAPVPQDDRLYYTAHTRTFGEEPMEAVVVDEARSGDRLATFAPVSAPHLDPGIQARTTYANQGRVLDSYNGFGEGAPPATNADVAYGNIGLKSVSTLQTYEGARPTITLDGKLAYLTRGDHVACLELESGSTVWEQPIEGNLQREGGMLATPPAVANGLVVIATLDGQLIAYDAASGQIHGQTELGAPVRSKPVIADERVFLGTEVGSLIMVPLSAL